MVVEYLIDYNDFFKDNGSVEFKFRANSKLISGLVRNGQFKFYIDGVDQVVQEDYVVAGLWKTVERSVNKGYHTMRWVYTRYINLPDDSMEDLAAEIEYLIIKGT